MKKHDEYTLYKKEIGNYIIRFMMSPFNLWDKEYKLKGTPKKYLVVKYNKKYDKDVPRGKGEGTKRKGWADKWKSHNWYDTSEEAITKYKSL